MESELASHSTNAGKVILVTGAGGGVGRAVTEVLLEQGASVAMMDRDEKSLRLFMSDKGAGTANVLSFAGDITDESQLDSFVNGTRARWGRIDGVCNVAGVLGPGPIEQASAASFDQSMHANCLSQLLLVQRALPDLRKSGRGSIVNVASIGALVALPLMSIYCASKAAVIGLTRAMALELAPDIRCNVVCPGGVDSPMSQNLLAALSETEREALLPKLIGRQLIKRFARPREVAGLIAYLISDEASFITGAVMPVEGGHSAW